MISTQAVLDATHDLVFEIGADGVFLDWQGPRERLLLPPERFLGQSLANILPPAAAKIASEHLAKVLRDGVPRQFEYSWPLQGGVRHFETRIARTFDGTAVMVVRDVEKHKLVERQARELESRFRVMADVAPVLLWLAGTNADCDFFNARWLQFTGRTLEEEQGVGWAEGIHFEDFQASMDIYLNAFTARKPFRMEYRLRRSDGAYRWILDTGVPRFAPDGTFAGFIGSCIDISELREAQQALRRLNEELEERVSERTVELELRLQEREVLVREVHHRVRNNLQLISSLLHMQGRHFADPNLRTTLDECQGRVEAIALVHEQLYRSKNLSEVEFAQDAERLARGVFASLAPPSVALKLELEEVTVSIERAIPLGLILNELMTNALKHAFVGRREGVIKIALARTCGERFVLEVEDDGVGLPEGFVFFRSTTLGTQIVHALSDQLGADVKIESQKGTCFRLELDSS